MRDRSCSSKLLPRQRPTDDGLTVATSERVRSSHPVPRLRSRTYACICVPPTSLQHAQQQQQQQVADKASLSACDVGRIRDHIRARLYNVHVGIAAWEQHRSTGRCLALVLCSYCYSQQSVSLRNVRGPCARSVRRWSVLGVCRPAVVWGRREATGPRGGRCSGSSNAGDDDRLRRALTGHWRRRNDDVAGN